MAEQGGRRVMRLDQVQLDRAAGVLAGLACGDALGAGYEFMSKPPSDPSMIGGGLGPWEPGEWTDDTQMALCIAEVAATGRLDPDAVAERFLAWYRSHPKDVGNQTRAVLSRAADASELKALAMAHFAEHPRNSAGNGSLMRTGPVALAHLGDDEAIAQAANAISSLTHGDPLAGEACVLWCIAIDRAVREGRLDGARDGLALLPEERRDFWAAKLDEAETTAARTFAPNGFVVSALQAAHAAIYQTPIQPHQPCRHLQSALARAVGIGHDTDTVAAIAGSLLGARWGASAVPLRWRSILHGWPGYRTADLVRLGVLSARAGDNDNNDWPAAPSLASYYASAFAPSGRIVGLDGAPGVSVGDVAGLSRIDPGTDVVVSLCRVGTKDAPRGVEHHEIWLMDSADRSENPNLDFILTDLAQQIADWHRGGKRVFVHCVRAESRTPTVAAAFLARHLGISGQEALDRVRQDLPNARPNTAFLAALDRLWPKQATPVAAEEGSPSEPILGKRFEDALVYAAELHRHQVRKGTTIPYVAHPLAVCSIVLEHGGGEDEAIAALLHDGPEDQGGQATLAVIAERFGDTVSGIVAECSDTFEAPKPPWQARKEGYLAHLDRDGVSGSVLLVSAADKLHNLRSILSDHQAVGDQLWRRFSGSATQQLWYYRSVAEIYQRRLPGRLAQAINDLIPALVAAVEPPGGSG